LDGKRAEIINNRKDLFYKQNENDDKKLANKGRVEQEQVPRVNLKSKIKRPSLFYCLWKIYYRRLIFIAFLKLTRDLLILASPLILGYIRYLFI
jgi:hypothetical protein